ncbi:MAG: GSU2086 family protein [Armatimonadota bacterium]
MDRLDRRQLHMYPLSERKHKLDMRKIAVLPDDVFPPLSERQEAQIKNAADSIIAAKIAGKPVMLTYGAHLIKNGLAPVVIQMIKDGWITHVATNGAGSIHDWEFAYMGLSTESVRDNTAKGQFGTWEETGRNINLAVATGGLDDLGYGLSVGKMIAEDGLCIPSQDELRDMLSECVKYDKPGEAAGAIADMLYLISEFDIQPGWMQIDHGFKEFSVQCAAYEAGIPFTVHPGIGYDIIYTHPINCGGAIGRGAVRDFLSYSESVSCLSGGVHISVGSAVMAPMIFEKSLSMANNLALQTGDPLSDYYLVVVDIQDGGDWDWSKGEPPMDNPAYYLRFCKSFYRMGGTLDYVCLDNRQFMLGLYQTLSELGGSR